MTQEDVDDYKKMILIQKSIDEVKRHAKELEEIRKSPERYRKVKSRIRLNMRSTRIQNKSRQAQGSQLATGQAAGIQTMTSRKSMSPMKQSMGRSSEMFNRTQMSSCSLRKTQAKKSDNPYDITDQEIRKMRNSPLKEKAM